VYAKGAVEAIPVCVNCGRDADTNANTVGAWVGALHGETGLPSEWVGPVCEVNKKELDIIELAEKLLKVNK
jgi:ADP-ribosylglycohydrolase